MTQRPGLFDLQVPFFRPLWRRIATTAAPLAWAVVEAVTGSYGWAVLFAAAGLYAFHQFFVVWNPDAGGD
ncbi:MAG: hypothetical protein KDK10_02550 [Maritimibacter sp.]|nr:hypothetical protein [Maritimibacter sp.]